MSVSIKKKIINEQKSLMKHLYVRWYILRHLKIKLTKKWTEVFSKNNLCNTYDDVTHTSRMFPDNDPDTD